MYKIYVVEDEINLANLITKYLKSDGYEITTFYDGESALKHIDDDCHVWILDIMLPGITSGYDLIKEIRKKDKSKPVIFTSARDQDIDKIMGLELGSDDYIPKPYSMRELLLRLKNIISRCYPGEIEVNEKIKYNEYIIDEDKRNVYFKDSLVSLTSKEYELLIFLLKNKGKAFSRDQLLDKIWGYSYFGSDRVVDDLVRRIRQKMEDLDIETIYGYGYRLK